MSAPEDRRAADRISRIMGGRLHRARGHPREVDVAGTLLQTDIAHECDQCGAIILATTTEGHGRWYAAQNRQIADAKARIAELEEQIR